MLSRTKKASVSDESSTPDLSLVFSSKLTSASNRDDSSENEIRRKHKHKQNHPNPQTVRCEVFSIQCLHRPSITTRGKYPCACVMPERYFVFAFYRANASISASTRKRKNFDPCACAYISVKVVFTVNKSTSNKCRKRPFWESLVYWSTTIKITLSCSGAWYEDAYCMFSLRSEKIIIRRRIQC